MTDFSQIWSLVITSGARSAERVYFYIPEKSQYERPAGRPAVVTLFERLFLWNRMTNSRTVILIRCHHPINHVFDRYRYPPVPATARGTCRGEGVEDTLSLGNSTNGWPDCVQIWCVQIWANAARTPGRLLCDGQSQRHKVNAIR